MTHPPRRPVSISRLLWLLGLCLFISLGHASCSCGPEAPQCKAKGTTCVESDECCTQFCSRDKCLCMIDEGGCSRDDQCCSGTCEGGACKPQS